MTLPSLFYIVLCVFSQTEEKMDYSLLLRQSLLFDWNTRHTSQIYQSKEKVFRGISITYW